MHSLNTRDSQTIKIIFFDGECLLCNRFVLFVLNRDKKMKLFFAPLQGETAHNYLSSEQIQNLDTIYFCDQNKIYTQSEAVIRIIASLGRRYRWLTLFLFIPPFIRNYFYCLVARSRYQIFGQIEYCSINHKNKKQILN